MNRVSGILIYLLSIMNVLQTGATIILITMVMYFIMVNLFEHRVLPVASQGFVKDTVRKARTVKDNIISSNIVKATIQINNKLPVSGINTDTGEPITNTIVQTVQQPFITKNIASALYNADTQGILPQNHKVYEKDVDFKSDITNINQFYINNPELFNKNSSYTPDVAGWDQKSKDMINNILQTGAGNINPSNFEHNFTSL